MWTRIIRSLWANIFLAALAILAVVSAVPLVRSALQVRHDEALARERLAELSAKKQELEAEIKERGGEEGVRYRAHLRLNLKNAGEAAVVVLPEQVRKPVFGPPPLWKKILSFFQGIIRP